MHHQGMDYGHYGENEGRTGAGFDRWYHRGLRISLGQLLLPYRDSLME
jgi:hypothetical protein